MRRRLRAIGLAACVAVWVIGCGAPLDTAGQAHLLVGEITGMNGACYADVTGHESMLSYDPIDGTAMFDGAQLIPVMWPVGYTARMAGEQVLEVLDKTGQVVARTGKFYRLIGRFHAGIFQTCGNGQPQEVSP